MSNDVRNEFSIKGSRKKEEHLASAIHHLVNALRSHVIEDALWAKAEFITAGDETRTFLIDSNGTNFTLKSAWAPCDAIQDQICWIFYKIDPIVVVQNNYTDEFQEFVGARIVTIENGKLISYRKDFDPSERIAKIRDAIDEESDEYEEMLAPSEQAIDDFIDEKGNTASDRVGNLLTRKLPNRKSLVWIYTIIPSKNRVT